MTAHIVTQGFACPICRVIVHRHCYEKSMRTGNTGCPSCETLLWGVKKKLLLRTRDLDSYAIPAELSEGEERLSDSGSGSDAGMALGEEQMQSIFDVLRSLSPPPASPTEVEVGTNQPTETVLEHLLPEPVAGPSRLANVPGGRPNEFLGRAAVSNYSDSDSEDEAGEQNCMEALDLRIRKT